ncbi:hypothetical protein [Streptomyces sp. GbtcB7]|uniref:hypothetical protein n=1 Tax=Streptomyces sp. GbtcB7 TaxID=2824752 RepID=UPI001C30F0FE|nr:hypothetical protein [Streptomyces sp. GbtcB7]
MYDVSQGGMWPSAVAASLRTAAARDRLMGSTLALGSTPLSGLDLTHLMPGAGLARHEAFRLAQSGLLERLADEVRDLDPENWRGERLGRTAMLKVMEEGIPLVWTPPADVIRALLDEPDSAARRKVLEKHAGRVVDHCRTVLEDIEREDVSAQVGYLNSCLDLLESGPHEPAQALAASVWDTVLRAMVRADPVLQNKWGGFSYGAVTSSMPKATRETTLGQFRAYCIHTCVHAACAEYYGPPVPGHYSRHATSHATGPTQYTLANALTAVMLAVALLRELEETRRPITQAE